MRQALRWSLLRYQIQTKQGKIDFSHGVIAKIVVQAASGLRKQIGLSNHRGKLLRYRLEKPVFNAKDYIEVLIGEQGVDIRINVVVRMGCSIGEVTEQLIKRVNYDLQTMAGLSANSIAVMVTGLVAKTNWFRPTEVKK
jgi:uncharacterized alkaline shock family protein YloU